MTGFKTIKFWWVSFFLFIFFNLFRVLLFFFVVVHSSVEVSSCPFLSCVSHVNITKCSCQLLTSTNDRSWLVRLLISFILMPLKISTIIFHIYSSKRNHHGMRKQFFFYFFFSTFLFNASLVLINCSALPTIVLFCIIFFFFVCRRNVVVVFLFVSIYINFLLLLFAPVRSASSPRICDKKILFDKMLHKHGTKKKKR